MNNELANDREYMKRKMKTNHKSVQLLGENLRKDPDFIMEMVRDKDFNYPWALLKVVDKSLLSTEFAVDYFKVLNDRGIITPNTIQNLNKILPEELRTGNKKLWDELIKWGIVDHEILDKNHIELRKKQKIDKMMERIETISIEEFMKVTNVINRGNEQFMLEVISRNPALYVCLSEKLKKNANFVQRLIEEVPSVRTIVDKDEQKRKAEYEQRKIDEQRRANEKEKQKEEEKSREEKEEKDRIIEEYKKLGEDHPNLILVNKFLEARLSKTLFCKRNNIDLSKLDAAIKEVSIAYPEIAQKVGQKNKQSAAIHITTIESINKKLLSGKMTLKEYSREQYKGKMIDDLVSKIPDLNKRKQLHTLVVESIASGELSMMDYKRLFSEEYDYKTIMNNVSLYMQRASREMPELIGRNKPINNANIKLKDLKKYSKSYRKEDFLGTKRGWATPDGSMETTTITEEYIEYAKKYLRLEDEYICYATMNSAILKIVKGEVSFEDIDKRTTKVISMQSVVTNAINNGTTMEDVIRVEDLPQKEGTITRE